MMDLFWNSESFEPRHKAYGERRKGKIIELIFALSPMPYALRHVDDARSLDQLSYVLFR